MTPTQPRFICTPYNPAHPRGKWTVFDRSNAKRYEVFGEAEAKGLVARIQAAEVQAFIDRETTAGPLFR